MTWEIQRHDWSLVRAERVPEALYTLARATTEEEAARVRDVIDSTVSVEGALYAGAVPTTTCLLSVLARCTPTARPHVLEILLQLGTGEPAQSEVNAGQQGLEKRCQDELPNGLVLFLSALESGSERERSAAVELLGLCCQRQPSAAPRVIWYLEKLLTDTTSESLKDLTVTWLRAVRALR